MRLNNKSKYTIVLGLLVAGLTSCTSKGNRTGIEYAPQMYISDAYEPFSQAQEYTYNPNGMSMRLPVHGTIARGQASYMYPHPNSAEGYEASASYTSWVTKAKEDIQEGERLYNIYCWSCHGKKGKNDGPIFKSKKMPGPSWPGYESEYIQNLPEGKIYHTITYGKGLMGSHAAMLSPEERWKVIHYVKYLSLGDAFEFDTESNADELAGRGTYGKSYGSETGNETSSTTGFSGTKADLPGDDAAMILTATSKIMFKGLPNRKELKASSYEHLDNIAGYLKAHPELKTNVVGHTGLTLTEEGAENLGYDRAQTVMNYLVSKGVNANNLRIKSVGNEEMDGSSTTAEGRQANRKVELEIYK
jgi:outer membrane protein OmpA-like peptidoglycan-associated protein/mono/diheme cytochrome c family protein